MPDFPDAEIPKAIPYGVYDVGSNEGWMSVGDDHDTSAFAVKRHRSLVAHDGPGSLSRSDHADDHRGCGRLQRVSQQAVEDRAGEAGGGDATPPGPPTRRIVHARSLRSPGTYSFLPKRLNKEGGGSHGSWRRS